MNKKTTTWIVAGVTVVAIGFTGLNVLAYNHARAMMRFTTSGDRTLKPEALTLWQKAGVLISTRC